jgi:hypothetical protein
VIQLVLGTIGPAGLVVMVPWIPILCASQVLRSSGQPGRALALIAMFVSGLSVAIRRAVPDVDAFWQGRLEILAKGIKSQGGQFLDGNEIAAVAAMMHEASLATMMLTLTGMLLLARWWQAVLYKPGAFGTEFRALVVPVWAFPVAVAGGATSYLLGPESMSGAVGGDVFVVLMILFAIQGLAIAHDRVAAVGGHWAWLLGIYVCAVTLPHLAATALAATGVADFVADFRRRRPKAGEQ